MAPELVPLFGKHTLSGTDSPILTRLVQSRAPIVLRRIRIDEELAPVLAQGLLADAVVLLPLLAHGALIGVMAAALAEEDGPAAERRLPLLKGIADQAAAAIAGARLIAAQREEAWVNTALLQVAEAIGRATDLAATLEVVARLTTTLTGLDRCTLWLRRPGTEVYELAMSYGRRPLPPLAAGLTWHLSQVPLLEQLRRERRPLVCDARARASLLPAAVAANLTAGAVIAVPLLVREDMAGMMLVEAADHPAALSPRLFDILTGIAHQAGVAIERAWLQEAELARQRLETELSLAHAIQRGFLPETVPVIPGYELAAAWEPARQIGGDFYDFIPLPDGRLGLVVGDVADKGIPAALYMALARTTMRLVAPRNPSPAAALQRVNTAILDTSYSDMFVTIYYAVLDPTTHDVVCASAGHGLAVHVTAKGTTFVRGRGSALGVLPTITIAEERLQLAPGDYLVLYTDGLTDAVNLALEDFGEARLVAFLEAHRGLSASDLVTRLAETLQAWCGDALRFDDYTLLVVRRMESNT
jgi:serine phosphatase RsbU (regulator of sigma subunit)